ncbi:2TM domain-containing protein [Polaribacter sp.]|nr:2TM domain-containing protein [Polaribacter sp.]
MIIHAAIVFIAPNILSKEWEERKIKEQMEKNEVG